MTFAEYLHSKKIDAAAFEQHEPTLFKQWQHEFAQLHPNSFTVQKLNLINPIRRKYQTHEISEASVAPASDVSTPKAALVPKVIKPVLKPKTKPDENVQ